jgi:hypothetical protein
MPSLSLPGENRVDALTRLWAFVWSWAFFILLGTLIAIAALILGLLDIIWVFLTDSEGIRWLSWPKLFLKNIITWEHDMFLYYLRGEGGFEWLPDLP